MVSEINRANPDLVCLAGDLFDNEYEAMADPQRLADTLSQIQSPLGVYACYGNHDVAERLLSGFTFDFAKMKTSDPRMDALLKKAGIRLLQDEVLLIDSSFSLAGRRHASKPGTEGGRLSAQGLLSGLDPQKPILVLDHEPRDLDALELSLIHIFSIRNSLLTMVLAA